MKKLFAMIMLSLGTTYVMAAEKEIQYDEIKSLLREGLLPNETTPEKKQVESLKKYIKQLEEKLPAALTEAIQNLSDEDQKRFKEKTKIGIDEFQIHLKMVPANILDAIIEQAPEVTERGIYWIDEFKEIVETKRITCDKLIELHESAQRKEDGKGADQIAEESRPNAGIALYKGVRADSLQATLKNLDSFIKSFCQENKPFAQKAISIMREAAKKAKEEASNIFPAEKTSNKSDEKKLYAIDHSFDQDIKYSSVFIFESIQGLKNLLSTQGVKNGPLWLVKLETFESEAKMQGYNPEGKGEESKARDIKGALEKMLNNPKKKKFAANELSVLKENLEAIKANMTNIRSQKTTNDFKALIEKVPGLLKETKVSKNHQETLDKVTDLAKELMAEFKKTGNPEAMNVNEQELIVKKIEEAAQTLKGYYASKPLKEKELETVIEVLKKATHSKKEDVEKVLKAVEEKIKQKDLKDCIKDAIKRAEEKEKTAAPAGRKDKENIEAFQKALAEFQARA